MASTSVIASLRDLWTAWNIRGFMILSLSMQLLLAIISPLRRRMSNRWVILTTWSTYLLADWAAIFAFGLISNAKCRNSTSDLEVDQDLLAFWSAFLLIYLGGPDSITAYSLEDNTLWLRHLVGLVAQVLVFLNIFVKTLPHNKFRVPTILIAIAGAMRYGERTRALYLASIENLKKSTVKLHRLGLKLNNNIMRPEGEEPRSNVDAIDNYLKISREKIKKAFHYFQTFKGLIVDMMPDYAQWRDSRDFFLHQHARMAYEIITMELKLFYEEFYTKVLAANSILGQIIRTLVSYIVLVALIMFCLVKKDGINRVDVRITYSQLAGVIALGSAGDFMLLSSNWIRVVGPFLGIKFLRLGLTVISDFFGLSVWSESTGALNLLTRGFKDYRTREGSKLPDYCHEIKDKIIDKMGVVVPTKLPYMWKNKLDMELWDFIFKYLQKKALLADDANKIKAVYEARGDFALRKGNFAKLKHYVEDFEFDRSLLVWHCATEICFQVDVHVADTNDERMKFSKILSDYMTYLLINQPKLMSPIAGIEQIRYHDTRVEAKDIGQKQCPETMKQFCKDILNEHKGTAESDDRKDKSVLSDACKLADALSRESTKWKKISKVWVEMLSYAASHCRADAHVRLLSEGGEFITFVWLLMAHFGIVHRFPKE